MQEEGEELVVPGMLAKRAAESGPGVAPAMHLQQLQLGDPNGDDVEVHGYQAIAFGQLQMPSGQARALCPLI